MHFSHDRTDGVLAGTTTRLLMACALGGVIGLEREWRHKASGLRTNMLICMGAALFTMLSAVLAGTGIEQGRRLRRILCRALGSWARG